MKQGIVGIMLASVSTMSRLAYREGLFDNSDVTPAIRANDTTDCWVGRRGMRYREKPSRPFSTCYLAEAQYGSLTAPRNGQPKVHLGLYSMTFNNHLDADHENYQAFNTFRAEAQRAGFHYFLEVFAPNTDAGGLSPEEIPHFVNDHICRTLAGVPLEGRPEFLKIPFFGPAALEELINYDSSWSWAFAAVPAARTMTHSSCWRARGALRSQDQGCGTSADAPSVHAPGC